MDSVLNILSVAIVIVVLIAIIIFLAEMARQILRALKKGDKKKVFMPLLGISTVVLGVILLIVLTILSQRAFDIFQDWHSSILQESVQTDK